FRIRFQEPDVATQYAEMGNLLSLNPKIHGLRADAKILGGFLNRERILLIVPPAVSITSYRLFQVHSDPRKARSPSPGEPHLHSVARCAARCAGRSQARRRCWPGLSGAA